MSLVDSHANLHNYRLVAHYSYLPDDESNNRYAALESNTAFLVENMFESEHFGNNSPHLSFFDKVWDKTKAVKSSLSKPLTWLSIRILNALQWLSSKIIKKEVTNTQQQVIKKQNDDFYTNPTRPSTPEVREVEYDSLYES